MKKPAGHVTLSSAEGEALIAQVQQSNLPRADAGMVEQIIRMYFWLVCALQDAKLSVKRLRHILCGSSAPPQERPASAAAPPASAPPGAEASPDLEAAGYAAGPGAALGEVAPKPKGGHRPGTGRLGAAVYAGAERVEGRHEELAVGQRCPGCGQGTL